MTLSSWKVGKTSSDSSAKASPEMITKTWKKVQLVYVVNQFLSYFQLMTCGITVVQLQESVELFDLCPFLHG